MYNYIYIFRSQFSGQLYFSYNCQTIDEKTIAVETWEVGQLLGGN